MRDYYSKFLGEHNKESPRGRAIISGSLLETLLEELIQSYIIADKRTKELFSGMNAPLGTLSSKITSAYALGLLNKDEYNDCEIVRKVRNEFAHNVHVSFDNEKIKSLCKNFKLKAPGLDKAVHKALVEHSTAMVALTSHIKKELF